MKKQISTLLAVFLLCFPTFLSAQKLSLGIQTGNVTGTQPFLKKDMKYRGGTLAYEGDFNHLWAYNIGIGLSNLHFDYYDTERNQVYDSRIFASLRFMVFCKMPVPHSPLQINFGAGLTVDQCLQQQSEIRNVGLYRKEKRSFNGTNISPLLFSGLDMKLNRNILVGLAVVTEADVYRHYNNKAGELKMNKNLLSIHFKKYLKKRREAPALDDPLLQ